MSAKRKGRSGDRWSTGGGGRGVLLINSDARGSRNAARREAKRRERELQAAVARLLGGGDVE